MSKHARTYDHYGHVNSDYSRGYMDPEHDGTYILFPPVDDTRRPLPTWRSRLGAATHDIADTLPTITAGYMSRHGAFIPGLRRHTMINGILSPYLCKRGNACICRNHE